MTATTIDAGDDLPLTVPALLRARVSDRPDQVFVVVDDESLTYGDADRRSAELARALLAAGAGWGTRVAILHPNGPEFVVAWLAVARIGAVSVPLSTFSTGPELAGLLRGADVSFLLSAAEYRAHEYPSRLAASLPTLDLTAAPPLLDPAVPSLRHLAFTGLPPAAQVHAGWVHARWSFDDLLSGAVAIPPDVLEAAEAAVSPADPMVIVHTSGSTSEPKGVVHSHGALIRHLDNLNELRDYTPDEILYANSPWFWIGGFAYALLGTLVAGAQLVTSNATTAAGVLDVLERERPTMVNGFAATVAYVADDPNFESRDLSSIRRGNLYPIMPAGVRPVDPDLRHTMFGMSETGSVCLASDDESDQPEHRRGSFGRAVPGFEARLEPTDGRAFDDAGEEQPAGEQPAGELWLRGPFLMEGYLGRERHDTFDAEGWFHTGDLMTVDDDGFFYFRGRASDMIKTAGANVSPREVEAAILEVAGLVAHVVGVDDASRGQVVAALVRAPAGDPDDVDVEGLRARLREQLSAYKVPRRFLVVASDDVPMTSTGKLDLRATKELFRGG